MTATEIDPGRAVSSSGSERPFEVALVDALSALDDLPREKTADTGSYSYRYADLAQILGYVRPILASYGFALTQPVGGTPGEVTVGTVLLHRTGATFGSPMIVAKVAGTPQQIGSTITYLRRYSLLATLGLATEDDDGSSGSSASAPRSTPRKSVAKRTTPRQRTASEALTARAMALFGELGYGARDDRLLLTSQILGRDVESWKDVDDDEKRRVRDYLEAEVSGPPGTEEDYG